MKRISMAVAVALLASFNVMANDKPVADLDTIMDLKQFCQDVAEDEGTDGMAMNDFLLQCVNDELDAEGYQAIDKLPE